MSLSSLIVQREIATIREIEEALARQVLYGGDFVTNLFEVSRIEEASLVPVVAEAFSLPAAPIGELPRITPEAARLVAAEVATERQLAVLDVGHSLVVAVAEPLSLDAEQELTFALALPIEQRIAPLFRIRQALARDYGVPIDKRTARLITKVVHKGPRIASTFPPPMESQPKLPARPPSIPPPLPASNDVPRTRAATQGTFVRKTEAPPARPARRRRGPLALDVAKTELEASAERDVVFDILFEFARQFFDYTALFIVHGEIAEGRDAFGDGASRDKVARVGVPLDLRNLLATARDAKRAVRKRPERDGLDPVLMADLGRDGTTECIVFPIIVRKRVVALLFGDGGASGIDDVGVKQVEQLVVASAGAFERVIMRRKLGRSGEAPEGGALAAKRKAESEPPPATVVSAPPMGAQSSDRPSAEELAPPIRDLMSEPPSGRMTMREPTPEVVMPSEMLGDRSDQPPPANLLAVRFPSGAPIPREEPDGRAPAATSVKKQSSPQKRAAAPPLEFGAPALPSVVGEASPDPPRTTRDFESPKMTDPPSSPKASSPPPMRSAPITDMSPLALPIIPIERAADVEMKANPITTFARVSTNTLTSEQMPALPLGDMEETPLAPPVDPDMTPIAPSVHPEPVLSLSTRKGFPQVPPPEPKPMPPSEQQVSVAPHKPPSSRTDMDAILPSVIVDVSTEYGGLVERVLKGPDDDAESELLRAGGLAMPAIMSRFPGPITIERDRLEGNLPRVADCGPVIRLIASQRRTALPFVLTHVGSSDPETRFWAVYLLTELVYPESVDTAVMRTFDEDPRVRRAARAAVRALAEVHPQAVVDRLNEVVLDPKRGGLRPKALEALGESREAMAIPVLLPYLEGEHAAVVRTALITITRQDFGTDGARWAEWWEANKSRHRLEWLIDSLMHEQRALRGLASEELRAITKEYFAYYDDLPKRERAAAQQRYRDWWETIGKVRFSKASTRGA